MLTAVSIVKHERELKCPQPLLVRLSIALAWSSCTHISLEACAFGAHP